MSTGIAALGPGEELIDPATFAAFFSNAGAVRETAPSWRAHRADPGAVSGTGITALDAGEELTDPGTFAAFFSSGSDLAAAESTFAQALGTGRRPAVATARLEAQIDGTPSRAGATELAVRLAGSYCEAAAVFVVHRGIVRAMASVGCPGRHETALFLRAMPSVFARVVESGEPYRGAPPDRVLEQRVLKALGRTGAEEIAVLPARVGDRILMLLYADNGAELVSDGSFAALSVLGHRLGRAYERMILSRKAA